MSISTQHRLLTPTEADVRVQTEPRTRHPVDVRYAVPVPAQSLVSSLPLLAADLLSVVTATTCVAGLQKAIPALEVSSFPSLGVSIALWCALTIAYAVIGLYPACGMPAVVEFKHLLRTATLVFGCVFIGVVAINPSWQLAAAAGGSLLISLLLIPTLRSLARYLCCDFDWWKQPILIIGDPRSDKEVVEAVARDKRSGLRPAGPIVDVRTTPTDKIVELLAYHRANRILVTRSTPDFLASMMAPGRPIVHLHVMPTWPGAAPMWSSSGERAGRHELHFKNRLLMSSQRRIKRLMDLAIILAALPVLLPMLIVLALVIKTTSRGSILYAQRRIGVNGRYFYAWKFRTMIENADEVLQSYLACNPQLRVEWERDHKLKNDPRISGIGRFLRKTSLDELPQMWNVIRGEMSLVGPRPIVDEEVSKYGAAFAQYKMAVPGITGMWQISGRNNTTYDARVNFDCYYVRNWSPWLDAYILVRTVKTVLLREGAY